MTKPGVQKPHCEPCLSTIACCTGMQLAAVGEILDRDDVGAVGLAGEQDAGIDRLIDHAIAAPRAAARPCRRRSRPRRSLPWCRSRARRAADSRAASASVTHRRAAPGARLKKLGSRGVGRGGFPPKPPPKKVPIGANRCTKHDHAATIAGTGFGRDVRRGGRRRAKRCASTLPSDELLLCNTRAESQRTPDPGEKMCSACAISRRVVFVPGFRARRCLRGLGLSRDRPREMNSNIVDFMRRRRCANGLKPPALEQLCRKMNHDAANK